MIRHCKLLTPAVLALLVCGTFIAAAVAGPFSSLIVFGDSLSDVGNIANATGGAYPGPYYTSNRFSNGPVYVEALATGLGLPAITRSTASGNDFAYGGAKTSGTGGLEGLFIRDVDEQVDTFLASRTANASSLYVFFAGSNDLVGGQANVNIPVNNLAEDMGRLVAAGATVPRSEFAASGLHTAIQRQRHDACPVQHAHYKFQQRARCHARRLGVRQPGADDLSTRRG